MADTRASISIGAKDDTGPAFSAIERSLKKLQAAAATTGKSASETKLYQLAVQGASEAQLKAADSALKLSDGYAKGVAIGNSLKTSLLAVGAIAATSLIAASVAFDQLIKKAGDFQDAAEKTGDTAQNLASLAVAAGTANFAINDIVSASVKLTKNLTGVDDESKAAGAAIAALGLDLKAFKELRPADQFEAVAKALAGFEDGASKTAVAVALFGKSGADALPFLKELGQEGARQVILTEAQIRAADDYSDRQARLGSEISLYAQVIAIDLLPTLDQFKTIIRDLAKDQDFASTAASILKVALAAAIVVFQAVTVVGANLAFVFVSVAREAEAIAKQLAALSRLDFKSFSAISDAVKSDGVKARKELDKFQAMILSIGNTAPKFTDPRLLGDPGSIADQAKKLRPKLNFDGATKKEASTGKSTADQEAKAQLAFDLDQIKKSSEAQIGAFSNAEKIMEARRSAALVSEADYYASKQGFLNLNSQAQEHALQQEIDRLSQEKLTGKDKIDNLRKIAEAQAKLDKVRENSVANIEVLKTQEVAANAKIAQSYVDATTAAQAYIDTVNKQNAREISGIGKGERFRTEEAGRSKIEDKQTTQRQGLEGDLRRGQIDRTQFDAYLAIVNDTYAKEVQAYEDRTAAIRLAQADWLNGASEAFANYQANAENVAGNSAAVFQNAFDSMTDGVSQSIASAIVSGKSLEDSLKSVALNVADAFIAGFIKMQIQKLFIDKAAAVGYAGTIAAQSQAMVAMAGLNAFASTAAIPYVGPALAPAAAAGAVAIAQGFALAATAAASLSIASARDGFDIPAGVNPITQLHEKEMVLPQAQANVIRDMARSGGNDAGGKGGAITIVNNTSARISKVTEQRLSNGDRALIIEEAVAATAAQLSDPNSRTSRSMGRNFAVARSR